MINWKYFFCSLGRFSWLKNELSFNAKLLEIYFVNVFFLLRSVVTFKIFQTFPQTFLIAVLKKKLKSTPTEFINTLKAYSNFVFTVR